MSTRQRRGILLAVVVVAFGLSGCGGGGDSSANTVTQSVVAVGAQENPAVTTAATGIGAFTVDVDTGAISGSVTTSGITATAAHVHNGPVGANAPVIVPMTQGPTGTWTVPADSVLTLAQVESFRAGNLYFNVHSAANPGGEARAQIGRQVFFATLAGAQETPPVTTSAAGTGRFIYDPATARLSGTVTTTGLTGNVAHLHAGAVGVAAPVALAMTGGPANWTLAEVTLTDAQVSTLLAGNFYANVHTTANPGGEIRGQVFVPLRVAAMAGANEVPPVASTASGTCWFSVNPFTKGVAGRIETTLTNATAAHAHRGATNAAGPVVIPVTSTSPGVWVTAPGLTISDDLLASFMKGDLYCNVHTAANPGGEIRGQLTPLQ
jgi:hypothetical protein